MKTLLAIATLLGGITSVWFLWERFASRRSKRLGKHIASNEQPITNLPKISINSSKWKSLLISLCTFVGLAIGAFGAYGYLEPMVLVSIFAGPIIGAIGDMFDEPGRSYQHLGSMLSNLGVFILLGAILGGTAMYYIEPLFQIKLSSSPLGIVMVILMGVAGASYGKCVP